LRKGWRKRYKHERGNLPAHLSMENLSMTLADIRPGQEIQVTGFLPQLPNHTQVRLKAYGMVPGVSLTVIQQSPVTIVSIEHLELALENDLARSVAVKNIL
jgi:Fe2+ transport system protein FeoA